MEIRIVPDDGNPYERLSRTTPWRSFFITARAMWVSLPLPLHALEQMSPQQILWQKAIEANGGVILSKDPEELRAEVAVALIRHPEMDIHDSDEVLIPARRAELCLDYPLSVTVIAPITATGGGITRTDILKAIHDAYAEIYRREDAASRPDNPEDRGAVLNRNRTQGPFGIWGHDIGDLVVEALQVFETPQGHVVIPVMGS